MKTSLKFLSLFFAASLPGALAVELAGVQLPAGLDSMGAFAAFVMSLVTLMAWGDYSRRMPCTSAVTVTVAVAEPKAVHPLAA
jgi:hypothetical protein